MAELESIKRTHNFKDIAGERFGMLTAIAFVGTDKQRGALWDCICDCGQRKVIRYNSLRHGLTSSCGCNNVASFIKRATTHGLHKSKEYAAWHQAKQRCSVPSCSSYENYGGRGIAMSERWANSFQAFYEDMGPCPTGLSLDRIDNNGPYTGPCAEYPNGNCRWATSKVQSRNKRRNIYVTHEGETLCIADWAQRTGISYRTLASRYHKGQPIFKPRNGRPSETLITNEGETLTLAQWAERIGISRTTLISRYKKGLLLFAPLNAKYSSLRGYKQ